MMRKKKDPRPFLAYTVIGAEWFTLRAAHARTEDGATLLSDVVNLDEKGKVLDRWTQVRLSGAPLLLAEE